MLKTTTLKFLFFYFFNLLFFLSWGQVEELTKKLEKAQNQKDTILMVQLFNKIGFAYWDNNQNDQAIEYFEKSIKANIKIGNNNALRVLHSNVANIYLDQKKYAQALTSFQEAEKYSFKMKGKSNHASALLNTASALRYNKLNKEAIAKVEQALSLSKELKNNTLIRSCYGVLAENYQDLGENDKAFEYFNLYSTFNQHMHEEELNKNIKQHQQAMNSVVAEKNAVTQKVIEKEKELSKSQELLEAEEELNRTNQELITRLNTEKKLKEKMLLQQQELNKSQQQTTFLVIGLLIFLIGFSSYIFWMSLKRKQVNEQLSIQKREIEEKSHDLGLALKDIKDKNHKIEGSINYAERIQRSMLPNEELLQQSLPESFIFFQPRDGVSGDFYWFVDPNQKDLGSAKLSTKSLNEFLISAVDCTGHGVPGAFMSMLGFNMLNNLVKTGITSTDEILNNLHKKIRLALKQETSSNKDGMDMALCAIYKEKGIVEFSGAKNPIVYIQNNELHQIKGDKFPIGGTQKEKQRTFSKHTISLNADFPTYIYLFSDGFQDQFGGEKNRKFMIKRMKQLLLEIHSKPMKEQKRILNQTINDWMVYQNKQIDDILVIGFRID